MRSLPPLAVACLFVACVRRPLPDEPIFAPRSFPHTDHQLPSGLRVVVHEDHSVPLVTVAAVYGAGATADPEEAGGLAHLVEHLTFRARGDQGSRSDRLKRAGATFNAATEADTTLYHSVGYRDALEDLLQIEVSRLLAPLEGVTADDVKVERQVLLNERRQRQGGTTGPAILSLLQQRLFPASHPLGRPLLGSEDSLRKTSLPLAQAFVGQHYRPENCTVVVAGDVHPDRVKELMKSWPVALVNPPGPPVPHRPPLMAAVKRPEPPGAETRLLRMTGPVPASELWLAWSLPGASANSEGRLWTLAAILEVAALPHPTEVHVLPLADGSILAVRRPLGAKEDPYRVRDRLIELLVSNEAVQLAMRATPILRSKARVGLLRRIADPVDHALELTRHLAATGRMDFYDDTLLQMRSMTVDGVARTMRTYLKRERAAAVVVDPEGVVSEVQASDIEASHLARSGPAVASGMDAADILRVARPPDLAALPRFVLRNGLQVAAIQRPAAALARVHLFLPGGSGNEVPYATLVSNISELLCPDTDALGKVGGSGSVRHGKFASHLSVVVPPGNLENGLAAVADQARCRNLWYSDFRAIQEILRRAPSRPDEAEEKATRAFWEALYPAHPYGRPSDVAALQGLDPAQASAYLRSHFRPNAAVTVVVSDLSAANVKPLAEEFLGGWARADSLALPRPPLPPPIPNGRVIRLFAETRRAQVHLRVGCRLPVDANALASLDVVERMVDEQANELRESWGATYGLAVNVGFFPGSAHLTIDGAVDSNQVGTALARLLSLLEADATREPDATVFTISRWEVARAFNLRFATGDGVAGALVFAAEQGWSPAVWDRYPAWLAAVDAARVQLLMKSCAGHEVVTLVGDVPALTAQLKASGLN